MIQIFLRCTNIQRTRGGIPLKTREKAAIFSQFERVLEVLILWGFKRLPKSLFGAIENWLFFMHSWWGMSTEPTASALGTRIHLKPLYNTIKCRRSRGLSCESVDIPRCRRNLPLDYVSPLFFRLFDLWKEKHF